jgi:hypothetical protein
MAGIRGKPSSANENGTNAYTVISGWMLNRMDGGVGTVFVLLKEIWRNRRHE